MSELLSKLLPIQFANGVATINVVKNVKLTKKQLATFKATLATYGQYYADRYLYNLMGLEKGSVHVARLTRNGLDKLANKRAGSILKQFHELLNCEYDAVHNPTERNVGYWVGVELECIIPWQDDVWEDDSDAREQATRSWLRDLIREANITRCTVKDDGSVHDSGDGVGVEVTVLFNTADGFGPLKRVCEVLKRAGCYVNDTCGLHVHLDARHCSKKDVKIIGNRRLGRALNILQYMVPKHRTVEDAYNKPGVSELTRAKKKRYRWINLTSWYEFKTIEVRMHNGTINHHKIQKWIELLRFFATNKVPRNFTTFQDFIDLGVPEHLVEYADKKISDHNPNAWAWLNPIPTVLSNGDVVEQLSETEQRVTTARTQAILDRNNLTVDDVFPQGETT